MYQRGSPYMLIMNIRYHEYIFISDATLIITWSECIYACFIDVQLYHSIVHSSDYKLTNQLASCFPKMTQPPQLLILNAANLTKTGEANAKKNYFSLPTDLDRSSSSRASFLLIMSIIVVSGQLSYTSQI